MANFGENNPHITRARDDIKDIRQTINEVAAALDAQATDKAAALEKVKRESSLMPFYCGDCGRWFVYPNDHKYSPDNEKHTVSKPVKFIRAENVLAILTDSEPKEEEAGR